MSLFFKKNITIIIFVIIFVATLIFFIEANPLVVFDTDDWLYMYISRFPLPVPGEWNPSRVFPEVFMPFFSTMASYIIYPLNHNFVDAQVIMHGLVLSVTILIYVYLFYKYMFKTTKDKYFALCITILFYLFHFLIFRSKKNENDYLFYSQNVTCYYFYTISTLLNSILVLWVLNDDFLDDFISKDKIIQKSIFVFVLYFAIFSNLFSSIIFSTYIFSTIVFNIKKSIKISYARYLICFAFLLSCLFELSGGRAKGVHNSNSLIQLFRQSIYNFYTLVLNMNLLFVIILIFFIFIYIYMFLDLYKKKKNNTYIIGNIDTINLVLSMTLTILFLLLLSSTTSPSYIIRMDVLLGVFFYLFIIMFIAFSIFKRFVALKIMLPLLIVLTFFFTWRGINTFKDSGYKNGWIITNDIVNQIIEVTSEQKEMDLHVPKFDYNDNFPIADYSADRFSSALRKHGIINNDIKINLVIDEDMNRKYLLD